MRRPKRVMAQMNVVPYIDVMLVLLVIFMVTAPMMKAGVPVNMPEADAAPLSINNQQEPITITVSREGELFTDTETPVSQAAVTAFIEQALGSNKKRQVYIKADGSVEYKHLMRAMVAVQQAGAEKIGLMAQPVGAGE